METRISIVMLGGGALELSLGLLSGCNDSRPHPVTLIPCVAATVSPSCFEMLLNMFY